MSKYKLKRVLTEAVEISDIKDIVSRFSATVSRLESLDPEEEKGNWKHIKLGAQLIPIKNLLKNDGARIIKIFGKNDKSKVIPAFEKLIDKFESFANQLSGGGESIPSGSDSYTIDQVGVYTLDDDGIDYAVLATPDKKVIGFVGLADPKKPCNNSTQIKYVALDKDYQGKGMGGFLYRLGGVMAEEYLGKSGITSDHTESSTKAAQNVWKGLSRHFDQFENESGNSVYDYTGDKTPDDKKDDCTKPEEGIAATDYTWEIKDSSRSKTQNQLDKMIDNAATIGEINDIGEQMMALWDKSYSQSRATGGLAESAKKRWSILAGI
jgi:GNAT superfamily N-acetyltransferase